MSTSDPFDHARSFGRGADAYARHRPRYPDALFDWLAATAPGRALAIDVAAGAGQGTAGLLERFARVIAVDQSPELLATIPAHPHLETRAQAAEALDVPPADLVATFQALHWFAGEPFWARVRASVRPGGVFFATTYGWFEVDSAVDTCISAELLPALAPHWSPKNQLLFDGYRTIDVPFDEITAPPFAIELGLTRSALLAYLGTWSAVGRLREVEGRDVIAELGARLASVWPEDEPRPVRMPLAIRAFRL